MAPGTSFIHVFSVGQSLAGTATVTSDPCSLLPCCSILIHSFSQQQPEGAACDTQTRARARLCAPIT